VPSGAADSGKPVTLRSGAEQQQQPTVHDGDAGLAERSEAGQM